MSDDLNTPRALPVLDEMLGDKKLSPATRLKALAVFDDVLGLKLATLTREALRVKPAHAAISPEAIEARLAERKDARAAKDFARSDAIRRRGGGGGRRGDGRRPAGLGLEAYALGPKILQHDSGKSGTFFLSAVMLDFRLLFPPVFNGLRTFSLLSHNSGKSRRNSGKLRLFAAKTAEKTSNIHRRYQRAGAAGEDPARRPLRASGKH